MSDTKFNLLYGAIAEEFVKELTRNLVEYNRSVGPPEKWEELVISVEGDDAAALGGLTGYTHWQWLFVQHLWVKATTRQKGIGAQLLAKAEQPPRGEDASAPGWTHSVFKPAIFISGKDTKNSDP